MKIKTMMTVAICLISVMQSKAQNPVIHHVYTADPAPAVHEGNDSLWFYCDIDEGGSYFTMNEWRAFSTVDMVNWTDHGSALPLTQFKWAQANSAWASQCIKRGNYYYWYVCAQKINDWRQGLAIGRSTNPGGPFTAVDANNPFIWTGEGGDIDPTVFIDPNSNQAYLYWGNNKVRYVKLNENMTSYARNVGNNGIVTIQLTEQAFGGVKVNNKTPEGKDAYEEGPWLDKHGNTYYLSYAAGGVPEHISYSTSSSPEGPWRYRGFLMPYQNMGAFTNHGGTIHYKGKDYMFYHTGWHPNGGGNYSRATCINEITYNSDGTINQLWATRNGVGPIATLSPYLQQQGETMNNCNNIKVVGNESTGVYVNNIKNGSWIKLRNVDFASGAKRFQTRVRTNNNANTITIRIDGENGTAIGQLGINSTNGQWQVVSANLSRDVTGTHDLYFCFSTSSANTLDFDWWQFGTEAGFNTSDNIVSGAKGDVHLSALDFNSWNSNNANSTITGTLNNNYGGGVLVDGGALIYGDNEVNWLKYSDLTGCTKLTIQGTDGVQVRALFNRNQDETFIEKSGTITGGKFEIDLSEVSTSYVHLNAIKTSWGSASGTIKNVYVNDPKSPIDYYFSGTGALSESAINALKDPDAKNINVFGLTNEEPITLTPANKSCLFYAKSANQLANTQNVVIKSGSSYTASNIVLTDGGGSAMSDIAQAGFPWASKNGDGAEWTEANNGAYTFSWNTSNCSVEIFHNLSGKTQNYLVVETSEYTAPWGVRFYDESGNLIADKGYWNGQSSNNMIKEINIDSLFAEQNVSHMRQSLKTVSVYNISESGRLTIKDMYLATKESQNAYYPFFAPFNISATNAQCSINVDGLTPAWIPFECTIPNGFNGYEINNSGDINTTNRIYANKPIIISGEASVNFTANNTTINKTNNLVNGNIIGVNDKTKLEAGTYSLTKGNGSNVFAVTETKNNEDVYINPLHGYISKNSNSAVLKTLGELASGNITGIDNIAGDSQLKSIQIYNLFGEKISQPQNGINIIKNSDGSVKKVLIKK